MSFDPAVFGTGFHAFVQKEYQLFGFLSPVFHIITVALLCCVIIFGNRVRRWFTAYFTLNWAFLFGYWGVYGILYWINFGLIYAAVYMAAPVLLFFILIQWVREWFRPELNFGIWFKKRLFICLPIMIWGFWYPSYIYGEGFSFMAKDLGFSFYGLMPCPTTMLVLSFMALDYPKTNKRLFRLMTAYALFIGTATVASGWLPDIPFILLGCFTFILICVYQKQTKLVVHHK